MSTYILSAALILNTLMLCHVVKTERADHKADIEQRVTSYTELNRSHTNLRVEMGRADNTITLKNCEITELLNVIDKLTDDSSYLKSVIEAKDEFIGDMKDEMTRIDTLTRSNKELRIKYADMVQIARHKSDDYTELATTHNNLLGTIEERDTVINARGILIHELNAEIARLISERDDIDS